VALLEDEIVSKYMRSYQLGVIAFIKDRSLDANPYDPRNRAEAYEAWNDGWHAAREARRRLHGLEFRVRSDDKPSARPAKK
jgi:hypothetical protein